jgi:hypothetical protein
MTAKLSRTIFGANAVAATDNSPAIVAQVYCVITTNALYTGALVALTGLTSETTETDYGEFPLLSVKEALRAGILKPQVVEVTSPNGTKTYYYTIYGSEAVAEFPDNLIGATWPIGVAAGGKITGFLARTRVKSRT